MNLEIFRAYDIRGIFGVDFQPKDFYRIARAYADLFHPKTVALGHDVRESSPELWEQVANGLQDAGVDVCNLGQISTDMLYFAVVHSRTDGGMIISASHNPAAYNGCKLVLRGAKPLSSDNGLYDLRNRLENATEFESVQRRDRGTLAPIPFLEAYLAHLRWFLNLQHLSGKRIVINANCGLAGQVVEHLLAGSRIRICERLFTQPDGTFSKIPGGRPDPLRPENRRLTSETVKQTGADFGVAWDADADRCFFFDERGEFVEGCYITALLSEKLLQERGQSVVIYDPRAIWAVGDAVVRANGIPRLSRCGHSFIKTCMRKTRALFAGESSGHYYFKDNFYADNGMIPFLLLLDYLNTTGMTLAESVDGLRSAYPVSGEINFFFQNRGHVQGAIDVIHEAIHAYGNRFCIEPPIDGLSVRFYSDCLNGLEQNSWRFNLRESNTEPLLRLNIESMGNEDLLIEQTIRMSETLEGIGGRRETKFRWED